MPNLKETSVIVAGQVIDIEATTDYESKEVDGGAKITVATGEGFALVKLNAKDMREAEPKVFGTVIWYVQYGAWIRNNNAQNTTKFVRVANPGDLDKLLSLVKNAGRQPAAASA